MSVERSVVMIVDDDDFDPQGRPPSHKVIRTGR